MPGQVVHAQIKEFLRAQYPRDHGIRHIVDVLRKLRGRRQQLSLCLPAGGRIVQVVDRRADVVLQRLLVDVPVDYLGVSVSECCGRSYRCGCPEVVFVVGGAKGIEG